MKHLLTIALMGVTCCVACLPNRHADFETNQPGDVRIVLEACADGPVAEADMDSICAKTTLRLSQTDASRYYVERLPGQPRLVVKARGVADRSRLRRLLQASGSLEFWETYMAEDVLPLLWQLDDLYAQQHEAEPTGSEDGGQDDQASRLASVRGDGSRPDSTPRTTLRTCLNVFTSGMACLGVVDANDTATVNRIIHSPLAHEVLPADLQLLWGAYDFSKDVADHDGSAFELFAIKGANGEAPLTGRAIAKAWSDTDYYGHPEVMLEMTSEGTHQWADLTRRNVQRAVAITVDGLVYSAPRVNCEITGGRAAISGLFTAEEAQDLAHLIMGGCQPLPLRIVEETVCP